MEAEDGGLGRLVAVREVEAMVAAGATRIGASAGVKIVRGEAAGGKGY